MGKIELAVTGMTCGNCVRHVKEALEQVPGVKKAKVELPGSAIVTAKDVEIPALLAAVTEAGYSAELE